MSLKNTLLRLMTYFQKKEFESNCQNIEEVFELKWKQTSELLLKDGYFWSRKGYKIGDDLNRFPITTYQDYEASMYEGGRSGISPFSGEKVDFLMVTSGTTGQAKPFLMTKSYKKQYQKVAAPFIHYMTHKIDYGLGKLIYLISLDTSDNPEYSVPTGTIGNYTYKKIPWFLKKLYALPSNILKSKEEFEREAPFFAIASEVAAIYCVTPPIAINFLENILSGNIKNKIQKVVDNSKKYNLSRNRETYLRILLQKDIVTPSILWPELQMLSCWTSSVCELSLPKLREMTGMTPVADGIYSATEGWVCVQTDFETRGSIYHPGSCILEFIEVGADMVKESLLKPWEIEIGKTYEVFFTNFMGLIRYQIGDILECTGFFKKSPILQFRSKNGSSLSLGILRLNEQELIKLFSEFFTPNTWGFFTHSRTGDGLALYLHEKERQFVYRNLADEIDSKLMQMNLEYAQKRQAGHLGQIQIYVIDDSTPFPSEQTGQIKPKIIRHNFITV